MKTEGWRWQEAGEPEDLKREILEIGRPGEGEVLVENRMIAFNPVDWKLIAGGHPDWKPGQVPGVDGVGVVVATGDGATTSVGTRVAYHGDLRKHGSFARHTLVPARALMAVPDGLTDELAACLPCPGLTAWQTLQKFPDIGDDALLVAGAGGAVGRFVVQLACQKKMRVFASAGRGQHDWLKSIGVIGVADYHDGDWKEQLVSMNGNAPFGAVIDLVASRQATELISLLGYYGHVVSVLGRVEDHPVPAFTKCVSLHEIALGAQHAFGSDPQWKRLVQAGEAMLHQLEMKTLKTPPICVGTFEALAAHLGDFRRKGQGVKYLVSVG